MRQTSYFPFKGGLNLTDPPLTIKPGELLGSSNYELFNGGLRRIDGYERLDGKSSPSEANYWLILFDAGTVAISAGDQVANVAGVPASSDLVGEVMADAVLTSGAWDGTGVGYFYVTTVEGYASPAYGDNDTLYIVGTGSAATSSDNASIGGASTDADNKTYQQGAIEILRARINQPGSNGDGDIAGVWIFLGKKYCFRNATGGATAVMYESSPTGWTVVNLGRELSFTSGGASQIVVGDTITGATSGATAIITDIVTTGGGWAAGDAVGYFYFASQTGTFQAENIDVGAGLNLATIAGDSTANALSPDGRYEFINYNFYGQLGSRQMYGCNGVNRAFKFDGTNFAFISTGMPNDKPSHVIAHKKHLFLSFDSSVQHSSIGEPLEWSAISGAAELATGDTVVGYTVLPDNSLGIFTRNSTYILYGSSAGASDTWNLTQYSDESGAIEWSIQRIGRPVYIDDRGFTDLKSVQAYGNFENAVFSDKIRPLIKERKLLTSASTRVREKNQYRVFFSNKTFIIASFDDNKFGGFTECVYKHEINCVCSEEDITDGSEILLFGAKEDDKGDAYVYQMEKGTSFDGAKVEAFLRFAYNNMKSPEYKKRFFKAVIECTTPDLFSASVTYDFSYGDHEDVSSDISPAASGGFWNISNWNEFTWGGNYLSNPEMYINGAGRNIGLFIFTELTYEAPHTFHGAVIHYSRRGLSR